MCLSALSCRLTGAIVDKKRRAGVGAMLSESESSGLKFNGARRMERGERSCCWGKIGDDGGDRAKVFVGARVADRLVEAVGVMSRLIRGLDCSW
jgi:hypothetical protein